MPDLQISYRPPGPIAAAFLNSPAPVNCIMGPWGSGKTVACLLRPVIRAHLQPKSQIDGKRYIKLGVIRDTYRQLWKTTIPSWHAWFAKDIGHWNGAEPPSHHLEFNLGGVDIDLTVEFLALGENSVEQVMKGWEGTWIYLNEIDLLSHEVLTYCRGRVGRYPGAKHGLPTEYGVYGDMNAPDDDNWTYDTFIDNLASDYRFFRQPSGLSPKAENRRNLPAAYYEDLVKTEPEWFVKRYVKNEFGYARHGKPVYGEDFNDTLHVAAQPLEPMRGLKLLLGFDAGSTPAMIIGQRTPSGRWLILREMVTEPGENIGPTAFGEVCNQVLSDEYPDWAGKVVRLDGWNSELAIKAWADPTAQYGASKDEASWISIIEKVMAIRIDPAPTNDLSPRLDSVRRPLKRMIEGQPGLVLSPVCKKLRKGFNSGYHYRKVKVAHQDVYSPEPYKGPYSHPHDGLQYLCCGGGEYQHVMHRRQALEDYRRQTMAATDDNPDGVFAGAMPGLGPQIITD